jgi:transposase
MVMFYYDKHPAWTALKEALSQALLQLQESDQRQQATEQKLDEALLEIKWLKELYRLKSSLAFTPSTEQMELLFDEAELLSQALDEEAEEVIEVAAHKRVKNKKHDLTTLPANTHVVDIDHPLEDTPECERCGSTTERTEDRIVLKVAVQPKRYYIERHHFPTTFCTACEADKGEENITTHWDDKKTDALMGSPSLVADCATRKYADGLPLYRQEAIFKREGFSVSRQTISNWLMSYIALLEPLKDRFKDYIYHAALINQDETPLQVLHLPKPATSKSTFMFVQVGTSLKGGAAHRIVLYSYIRNRKKETLQSFTEGYTGYVMTDYSDKMIIPIHRQRSEKIPA